MKIKIILIVIGLILFLFISIKYPPEITFKMNLSECEGINFSNFDLNYIRNIPDSCCGEECKINMISKENVLNRTYVLHKSDCTHFSTNLTKKLKDFGFNATCVQGYYRNLDADIKSAHMWVRVYGNRTYNIESTPKARGIIEEYYYNETYLNSKDISCYEN